MYLLLNNNLQIYTIHDIVYGERNYVVMIYLRKVLTLLIKKNHLAMLIIYLISIAQKIYFAQYHSYHYHVAIVDI